MKLKVTFTEEQLIELVQATIKNKFPHENIEIGKSTINYAYKSSGNMDRDGRLVFKDIEVEVDFK
jgi:hypothetical protein